MPLERGTLLNKRYRVVEILGQGGMGSVYRAVDENLGVDLAIKENLFTSEEYSRQFRREATILASLRHPNLPRVTDHFEIDNRGQYLIMDYIEGEDLRQRMDRDGILPEEEVIVIGMAICDALTYLHTRRPSVVHRDIKPGNVKIAPDGRVFLVDFGLAKLMEVGQATTTGARAMTPGYSPPEQYGTARTDHRTDIYSLGATLYAAICGALPEDGLARAMDQAELTQVRKRNSKVSRKLAWALEKALAIQPDQRFQSAEEMKQALQAAAGNTVRRNANGELTVKPPPAIDYEGEEYDEAVAVSSGDAPSNGNGTGGSSANSLRPMSKPSAPAPLPARSRNNRMQGCLVTLVIIGIFAVGLFSIAMMAIPAFASQMGALFAPVFPGLVDDPSEITPTPSPSATVGLPPTDESGVVVDVPTSTLEPSPTLTPTATATQEIIIPATSTDIPTITPTIEPPFLGNSAGEVAFVSDRTGIPQVWITNVDGLRFRQLTNLAAGACNPAWSPDGTRVVFISPCAERSDFYLGAAMYVINVDGSGLRALLGAAAGDYEPAWSPDGKKIAFTTLRGTGRPQVWLLDLDTGETVELATTGAKNAQPVWSPDGTQILYVSAQLQGERLWIMNADGSNQQPVSPSDGTYSFPDWPQNGEFLVFNFRATPDATPRLYFSAITPFAPLPVTSIQSAMRDVDISPDGLWLVYEGWPSEANHDIWIMSIRGDESRVLVNNPYYDFNPVWRPAQPTPTPVP